MKITYNVIQNVLEENHIFNDEKYRQNQRCTGMIHQKIACCDCTLPE